MDCPSFSSIARPLILSPYGANFYTIISYALLWAKEMFSLLAPLERTANQSLSEAAS